MTKTKHLAPRLAGKRAFITGAAGGLGRAIARRMAEQGAQVFLTDIVDAAVLEAFAAELNDTAGERIAWAAVQDVADEAQWASRLSQAADAMGGLSVLVHNAGVGSFGAIGQIARDEWRRVMAINVESIVLGTKHALPYLEAGAPRRSSISRRSPRSSRSPTTPRTTRRRRRSRRSRSRSRWIARAGRRRCAATRSIRRSS